MGARKVLHEEDNSVSKVLTRRKEEAKSKIELIAPDSDIIIADDTSEVKNFPDRRKLLAKQYYRLRTILADYIDNAQIKLFDQAIRIMDKVHINREDKINN